MFFVFLRPIFCEKWKIAPPHTKRAPLKRLNLRNWEKNRPEIWRRPFFFFWRSPNFGRKKRLNFGFRPKNHSEFWRRPFFFFFWRPPNFGRKKRLNFGFRPKNHSEFCVFFFFFFWRPPNFGRKKRLNFGFRPKNHSEFWRRPFFFFFFWRPPNFGRKKPLNFRSFRDISSQISDKPSETDSRSIKIRVNVVCTLLTLSK